MKLLKTNCLILILPACIILTLVYYVNTIQKTESLFANLETTTKSKIITSVNDDPESIHNPKVRVEMAKENIRSFHDNKSDKYISDPLERQAAINIVSDIYCEIEVEEGHVTRAKMWVLGDLRRNTNCYYDGNPELLSNLVYFTKLRSLNVNCGPCTDVDLCWFSQLKSPEFITLHTSGSNSNREEYSLDQRYAPMVSGECLAWLPAPEKFEFIINNTFYLNSQTQLILKRFVNDRYLREILDGKYSPEK